MLRVAVTDALCLSVKTLALVFCGLSSVVFVGFQWFVLEGFIPRCARVWFSENMRWFLESLIAQVGMLALAYWLWVYKGGFFHA